MDDLPLSRLFDGPAITFTATPTSLLQDAAAAQTAWDGLIKEVCQNPAPPTFENTILPLALLENRTSTFHQEAQLLAAVSAEKDLREAASQAQNLMAQLEDKRLADMVVFERISEIYRQLDNVTLDAETRALIEKWHRVYSRNGCGLDAQQRQQLEEADRSISELRRTFRQNLVESNDVVWLRRDDLEGLPLNVIDTLEVQEADPKLSKNEQLVRVPLQSHLVQAILRHVHSAATRKTVFLESETARPDHVSTFAEIMQQRQRRARLMGFESFASSSLAIKMAQSPEYVMNFLDDLQWKLKPAALVELEKLKQLKKNHLKTMAAQDENPEEFFLWDHQYYHELYLKQRHLVNGQRVSEYFPLHNALMGMFQIFEDVFGIQFKEIGLAERTKLAANPRDLTWHDDVGIFAVLDRSSDKLLGHLYTDLLARDGKYTHNANFNIRPGFTNEKGNRVTVATALVTNFSPPSSKKPTLLYHRQVITLFHELGHAVHDLLSCTRFSNFHGHHVKWDFVEMPSQMLENWCWLPDQLALLSRHYTYLDTAYADAWRAENEGQELPPERLPKLLAEQLTATRTVNLALSTLRQIHIAKFDLYVHGHHDLSETSIEKAYNGTREEIGLLKGPDSTSGTSSHWYTTIPHFVEGSASNYYSYLFSQVYSADIFDKGFKQNPRDSVVGRRYRKLILEPGGSLEPMDMIREFLGRDPQVDAFHRDIGITTEDMAASGEERRVMGASKREIPDSVQPIYVS